MEISFLSHMTPSFPVISSKIQPFLPFPPRRPLSLNSHNLFLPNRLLAFACRGSVSVMKSNSEPSLFPSHRCKTLHLVRLGQVIHSVVGDKNPDAYLNPQYLDAHLTQPGWQQVDNLRKHVQACELSKKIDLVIISPLMRTLQTAAGVFGYENYSDGMSAPPLMVANAGKSGRAAISSMNCPPVIAVERCREHLGVRPYDKRSSITDCRILFPGVDFSLDESNEDILWKADIREAN